MDITIHCINDSGIKQVNQINPTIYIGQKPYLYIITMQNQSLMIRIIDVSTDYEYLYSSNGL